MFHIYYVSQNSTVTEHVYSENFCVGLQKILKFVYGKFNYMRKKSGK